MSSKKVTSIDLTVISSSDTMSVDNNYDELVVTISSMDNDKPSSQPATYNLSYSSLTPITVSESALYPSSAVPATLMPFSTSSENTKSIQEGFHKMSSEGAA